MNGGFTSLIGRSNEISQQLRNLQQSLDVQHLVPDVSRNDLLRWIDAIPTHDDYNVALEARVKDTCNWVLDNPEVQAWLALDPLSQAGNHQSRVLWIHGKPGSGKTIISASLVEYLKKHKSAPVCYFFCFYNHEGKKRCNNIVGSWVSQLVGASAIAFQIAKEIYKKKESHTAAQVELWQIFQAAIVQIQECYFAIDGFDECVREDVSVRNFSHLDTRALFLQQLDDAISKSQARVLLVSREDVDIRERLRIGRDRNAVGSRWNVWKEYEITRDDTAKDIERFSRDILGFKLSSSRATAELKEELATDAAEKSEGMFLWIKLIYARLSRSNSASRLRSIISSTPSGLDQAYQRDLMAILSYGEEDQIRAIAILRWTLFAERPLTVRELCEALITERELGYEDQDSETYSFRVHDESMDQADIPEAWDDVYVEDQILKLCGSLIVVRGEDANQPIEDHAIYFVHFSVKEYLLKVEPFVYTSRAHTRIAISCVKYLCYEDFYQEHNSTLEQFDRKLDKYAFLSYAGVHLNFHAESCRPFPPAFVQWCKHLLDPKASRWISYSEVQETHLNEAHNAFITNFEDIYPGPLYYASLWNMTENIQWLLDKGEDVKQVGGFYGCPLNAASVQGSPNAVTLLLTNGADLNCSRGYFGTSLQIAAFKGNEFLVDLLLAGGADANQEGGYYNSPLVAASRVADSKVSKAIVCRLIEAGANVKATSGGGITALHNAAYVGCSGVIQYLIENKADIDAKTDDGRTPLHTACYKGNEEAIHTLIESGADVNAVDAAGASPLHKLADLGTDALVELLLKHGADVKARELDGGTALHNAAQNGSVPTIRILLHYGADMEARDNKGSTPLHLAAYFGNAVAVASLLELGASILSENYAGISTLYYASMSGHEECIKVLLANGSDVKAVTRKGATALHCAAFEGHENVLRILLANGSDIGAVNQYGSTVLHVAAYHGNEKIIEFLLSKGIDIYAEDKKGRPALYRAIRNKKLAAVKSLIKHGTNVQAKDSAGKTALHYAAYLGDEKIMEYLLSKGADMDATDDHGETALHEAVYGQQLAAVKLLSKYGANIQAKTLDGHTVLHFCAQFGDIKVVEFVLSKGIDIHAADFEGDTALHCAVWGQNLAAVDLLLNHGASLERKNLAGKTPLDYARYRDEKNKSENEKNESENEKNESENEKNESENEKNESENEKNESENEKSKSESKISEDERNDDQKKHENDADKDENKNESMHDITDLSKNEKKDNDVAIQKIISLLETWDKSEQRSQD